MNATKMNIINVLFSPPSQQDFNILLLLLYIYIINMTVSFIYDDVDVYIFFYFLSSSHVPQYVYSIYVCYYDGKE